MTLEELLNEPIFSRPEPENPVDRIKAFAFELAYGASQGIWGPAFYVGSENNQIRILKDGFDFPMDNGLLSEFVQHKWRPMLALVEFMKALHYLEEGPKSGRGKSYIIGPKASDLLEQIPQARIFISYYNAESSAFALLLHSRMKEFDLIPYLDITNLEGGQEWENTLENNIINSDTVIVLLGPKTLEKSEPVQKEIELALHEKKRIIPVLHNGYRVEALKESDSPFADALCKLQCVTVEGEKARYYNLAVLDVLNIFRVNP